MKQILIILLLASCSSSHNVKYCEFECVKCEGVKIKCLDDKKEIDVINKAVL